MRLMPIDPNLNIVRDGLIAWYDVLFQTSYPDSGTTWYDLSGNDDDGTLVNGVGYDSANGGSLDFDGVDDYVTLGSKSFLTGTSFTLQIWVKFDVLTSGQYYTMFSYGGYVAGGWLFQREGASNKLRFAFDGTTTNDTPITFTTTGVWTYISLVVNSGVSRLVYIDTTSYSIGTSGTLNITNPKTVEIARRTDTNSQYVNGKIGQISIYNKALTAAEIQQNYNTTKGRFI